jgi:hypothetical protein
MEKQTQQQLEDWYSNPDPWGYQNNADDRKRLNFIINMMGWGYRHYKRALDVGCGEGFVTQHIPADEIHGMDISTGATSRLPHNVKRVEAPVGKYDLVMSTGTLYQQYDHESIYRTIVQAADRFILIGGISDWLVNYDFGRQIHMVVFPYREFSQKLTIYEVIR